MDPNTCLSEIRDFYSAILSDSSSKDNALALAEYVRDMDEWLRDAGFLPDAWDKLRPTAG